MEAFHEVAAALEAKFGPGEIRFHRLAAAKHGGCGRGKGREAVKLIDGLENSDDVQAVYANFEMSGKVMEKLSA